MASQPPQDNPGDTPQEVPIPDNDPGEAPPSPDFDQPDSAPVELPPPD